jgi:diamine N-acetyltransferase
MARGIDLPKENETVDAGSPVSLQEIAFDTVRLITALEVSPNQKAYVAPNAVSIAEAHFNPGAWFRAIHAGTTPVGFVMLFDPTLPGGIARGPIARNQMGLWRLMIDHRYQSKGFGRRALDLICGHARSRPGIDSLLTSYLPGIVGPEAFYFGYGFQLTGRRRSNDREIELILKL